MGGKTKARIKELWEEIEALEEDLEHDRARSEKRLGILEKLVESNRLGTLTQVNHEHRIVSQKKCLNDLYNAIETWEKKLQSEVESGRRAFLKTTGHQWAIKRLAKKLQALTGNVNWRILKLETWAGKRPVDPETGAELEYPCPYCGSVEVGHVCEAKKTIVGLDSQPAKITGFTNVILPHPDGHKNVFVGPEHEKDEEQDYEKIVEENRYEEEKMSEHEDTQWLDGLLEMLAEPAGRGEMLRRLDELYARGCTCAPKQRSGPKDSRCHSCFAGETLKRIRYQYIRDMCNLPASDEITSFTAVMEAVDRLEHKFKRNLALGRNAGQAVGDTGCDPEAGYTTSETKADAPFGYAVGSDAGEVE